MADTVSVVFCGGGGEEVCGVVGFDPDFLVGLEDCGGEEVG